MYYYFFNKAVDAGSIHKFYDEESNIWIRRMFEILQVYLVLSTLRKS